MVCAVSALVHIANQSISLLLLAIHTIRDKMAHSGEQINLKWNDFHSNILTCYSELQSNNHFSDVTLVGEGNEQIEAHRVILSASSPFLNSILQRNKHSHPLIYMRGVKANELVGIVHFIYQGEANIFQEDLQSFLSLAEDLQLKGLAKDFNAEQNKKLTPNDIKLKERLSGNSFICPEKEVIKEEISSETLEQVVTEVYAMNPLEQSTTVDGTNIIAEQIRSMMRKESGKKGWVCQVCGKTAKKSNIAQHIESNHTEGFSHTCNTCGKTSKSADGLRHHRTKEHRN